MLTDDERQLIYEQIAAQKRAEDASQREATAKSVHNSLLVQISEDAARLTEHARQLLEKYANVTSAIVAINEKLEDLHARQAVIDRHTKLILELERSQIVNIRDKGKREELEQKIDEAQGLSLERASIKRRLQIQTANLNYLREQEAKYGGREPVELAHQIVDVEDAIRELQSELKRIED